MDIIEVAQRRQAEDIEHALANRKVTTGNGRSHCMREDCGEPISACRQALGAQLCIDCQRDVEREAQQCARGAV